MNNNKLIKICEEITRQKSIIGCKIYFHETLESTMTEAKNLVKSKSEEGTTVIAEIQTNGRGRLGRNWISPKGGIWMSIILYPNITPEEVSLITLAAATAVCTVIEQLYNVYPCLKWPNDIILNGKKICGILTEGSIGPDGLDYAILGIGLNLNFDNSNLPEEIKNLASTVISETGINFETEEVLRLLLLELNKAYKSFLFDREKILRLWESYSTTLGQNVSVVFDNRTITGTALRITGEGHLVVFVDETGEEIEVDSGEVSIRPPMK